MRNSSLVIGCLGLLLLGVLPSAPAGEVAIYTGTTQWISKGAADQQAQICTDALDALSISNIWFTADTDMPAVAEWVTDHTDNGETDVLVLYGDTPPDIYPQGNAMPDDSIAELFIESTDGDAIINHADYMFWGLAARNSEGGLQNMMDIPGIVMWDDNTPVTVTPEGADISPTLAAMPAYTTDRPFHLDQLAGEWAAEVILAQNEAGTRADPVIVRDGDRGRLIPIFQSADSNDPKGIVAAEIIAFLFDVPLPTTPTKLLFTGPGATWLGTPLKATVQLINSTGGPRPKATPTVVNLTSNSGTGRFDTAADGPFDGSVTSITIPAGETQATIFYNNTAAGAQVLTVAADGLESDTLDVNMFTPSKAPAGEVAIYTGTTQWIAKNLADEQAQIAVDKLEGSGITNTWFQSEADMEALAEWVTGVTDNGQLDVLVLYGDFPPTLYPQGNTMPDGSVAELFIESTDGDAIINHADYMFWGLGARNGEGGLQNMMDIPGIVMWDDNTPVLATEAARTITPSLNDILTDRPFHVDQLANEWLAELVLAQNAAGTRADPIIVRDGDRGRLIPVFQSADQVDPKGDLDVEIISWLFGTPLSDPTELAFVGAAAGATGAPLRFRVNLRDLGAPRPAKADLTVNLASDSATGRFDSKFDGPFDGSVTSIVIPAGKHFGTFFYKDTSEVSVKLTGTATGLTDATIDVNILQDEEVTPGEVMIYTGTTQWVDKPVADAQAAIYEEKLSAAGISSTLIDSEVDWQALTDWVEGMTGNGQLDVLVLFGDIPSPLYPDGNVMPDDSPAELFVESTDGDVIINHADYMFWGLNARNSEGGLQNITDIPGIVMWDDNTSVTVTPEGADISPTLGGLGTFLTDRPFHVDQLANEWFAEVTLAENYTGTRADPIIVRDGNRGRLIPLFQSAFQADPMGAVGSEVIIWLFDRISGPGPGGPLFKRGDVDSNGVIDISDPVGLLGALFLGSGEPACLEAADFDDNGEVDITDAVNNLGYQFLGSAAPAPPGPLVCGPDPAASAHLECDRGCP